VCVREIVRVCMFLGLCVCNCVRDRHNMREIDRD